MIRLAKKRVGFKTLGCRLNQFETDALASKFVEMGYEVVEESKQTDVFVVNTCTVTNQSDQKSRYIINHAIKHGHTGMLIITGCMVNHHKEAIEAKYPNAYVVDNENKSSIPQLVQAHFKKEIIPANPGTGGVFSYAPASETFHTRSMIKIQDGCDNFCTFCIIPRVRGRAVSRPVNDILSNIKEVVGFGYKEVVLTGVNISRYKYGELNFSGLLARILELPFDFRVRISSIEPDSFDDQFFDLIKHPKMTPHLHLCLQSASEQILLKMRRMYTFLLYRQIIQRLKKINPLFNVTTDIIVGFPGETESDFQNSLSAVDEIGFGHVHVFKYSKRENTRAARMDNLIPEKTKTHRSEILRKKALTTKYNYRQQFIGLNQYVLVEKIDQDGFAYGYGENYIPVKFKGVGIKKNQVYKIKINSMDTAGDDPVLIGLWG